MAIRDPRIDDYIARAAPFAQPVLAHLRAVVHAACPDVAETLKWGMPHFDHRGRILAHMAAFKQHCVFGIPLAAAAQAQPQRFEAMGEFGRITSVDDLPAAAVLERMLHAAASAIEQGAKLPRAPKSGPRPPPEVPPDLAQALAADATAQQHFDALPPGQRREYVEWITGAKQAATRGRRLAQALAQLAEGKPLNWKYQRPKPAG